MFSENITLQQIADPALVARFIEEQNERLELARESGRTTSDLMVGADGLVMWHQITDDMLAHSQAQSRFEAEMMDNPDGPALLPAGDLRRLKLLVAEYLSGPYHHEAYAFFEDLVADDAVTPFQGQVVHHLVVGRNIALSLIEDLQRLEVSLRNNQEAPLDEDGRDSRVLTPVCALMGINFEDFDSAMTSIEVADTYLHIYMRLLDDTLVYRDNKVTAEILKMIRKASCFTYVRAFETFRTTLGGDDDSDGGSMNGDSDDYPDDLPLEF